MRYFPKFLAHVPVLGRLSRSFGSPEDTFSVSAEICWSEMRWEFSTVLLWESLLGEEMECVSAGVSEPCVILSAGTAFSRSRMGPWCSHCSKWFLPVTLSQCICPVTSQHWLVQEQRKRIGKCWGGGTGSTCSVSGRCLGSQSLRLRAAGGKCPSGFRP